MSTHFDVIVLGCGGMGSAAAFRLADRGHRVLGLEQFSLAHHRGSSHGRTRVIRTAYYEHPDYVPLLQDAFDRWYDLEQRTGEHLLTECGCLSIGPTHGELLTGVAAAAERHDLDVSSLTHKDVSAVGLPFELPQDFAAIYEDQAGYLDVERCVRAHLDAAVRAGATIKPNEPVLEFSSTPREVTVRTATATYTAAKLVVTAGGWATRLLADAGVPLTVMRQVQLWFEPNLPQKYRRDVFPAFLCETPLGYYYGVPMICSDGVKIARHFGEPEKPHPEDIDWTTGPEDEAVVRSFLDRYLPGEFKRCVRMEACQYTLTPDRHFVIDNHPTKPNVVMAAGFSGHGFKFTSVVGEILADLAEHGRTDHPIELFAADRFS